MAKEKKSFKKFAKKHLAGVIERRRQTAKSKKEKKERLERKKVREVKKAKREEDEHAEQLDRLKDTDPEFYSYLEEEDPTLLQFGKDEMDLVGSEDGSDAETEADEDDNDRGSADDEDDSEADLSGDDDEEEEEGGKAGSSGTGRIGRDELERILKDKTMGAGINVFVSAIRELGYNLREPPQPNTTRKFDDPALVKESLLRVAQMVAANISLLISGKGAFKSQRTRHLVKRYLFALSSFIGEGNLDPALTAGLLHALTPFVPLLHYVKGVTKAVLKASLALCTASEEPVRIAAYVVVRTIATRATGTRSMYQSTAFKGIFLALIRSAHRYTIHTQPVIAFLMNCVVDLYGTDMEAAYQHTFVYLRQLGVYLRAALQQQSQSNVRAVVNWQYLNALRTWGAVVSTYSEPAQLGPLIHPVVQIATGMMDLFSSPRMFPMHLQIIEVLNHIASRADRLYIPVAPYLLRILTSPSVALNNSPNAAASTEEVELPFTIRVKKSQARSNVYHRAVWTETLYLLTEHLATHSNTIGFPESFWAVESTLKKMKGEVKVPKLHSQISVLLRHYQSTAQRIIAKRDQANCGPCDLTAVKQLEDELTAQGNPLITYHQSLRQQRAHMFMERQKSLNDKRVTLESTVQQRRAKKDKNGRKRPRSDE